ncbi:hypothetical protein F4212_08960 [Candidatus Poribacteria bacterium]|nr:hypothetical protein [Candidatus Poribacteria bacterium]
MSKRTTYLLLTFIPIIYFTSAIGAETEENPDPYGIKLSGVGALKTEIPHGNGNVLYTIRITNTGIELDTISLTTEGTVTATLTRNSVTLTPNAYTDVVIIINEDALTDVGTYVVNVTATSKGDPTKTATITTTTTIFTCGVEVVSVGDVTIETKETGTTASYKISITNIGSRSDTVSLSTSGEIEVMLSETSLHLEAGASTDVTLTISVDVLTMMLSTPDEYAVTVTATSENVSTETAKITSTITIKNIPGDLTDDGVVNILDLVKVASQFGSIGESLTADVTMDGVVNILDLVKVASQFGETQMDYAVANISISHE